LWKVVKQLRRGGKIEIYNPEIIGTPTYVPFLATETLRIVRTRYEGIAHIAGWPKVKRLTFARQVAGAFGYEPGLIEPNYGKEEGAPRPLNAGLICDHNGYQGIDSHNYRDGLLELSKKKGIYNERPMARMETG
jgi:dTDP-4-dehydrorhamnose reductase